MYCHINYMMCTDAGKVSVPKQLVIIKDPSSIPDAVSKAGLTLPLGNIIYYDFLTDVCAAVTSWMQ